MQQPRLLDYNWLSRQVNTLQGMMGRAGLLGSLEVEWTNGLTEGTSEAGSH